MWTGCGQRAVYTTRKHGGLADWAITELEALLDSLSFSFQRLNLSFLGTCSTHTVPGLHTWTAALPCRAPPLSFPLRTWSGLLHGGHYYKVASRLNKILLRVRPSFRCETKRDVL